MCVRERERERERAMVTRGSHIFHVQLITVAEREREREEVDEQQQFINNIASSFFIRIFVGYGIRYAHPPPLFIYYS